MTRSNSRTAFTVLVAAQCVALLLVLVHVGLVALAGPGSSDSVMGVVELAWLAVSATQLGGLVLFFRAGAQRSLALSVLVVSAVDLGFDVLWQFHQFDGEWLMHLSTAAQLAQRTLLLVLVVRAGSRRWLLPLAFALAGSFVIRTGVGTSLRWLYTTWGPDSSMLRLVMTGRMLLAFLEAVGMVAFLLGARASLHAVEGTAAPAHNSVATADFTKGGVILGLGLLGTLASASFGGGRFVVLTGAIGVGLGLLVRGLLRLAKE